eukprot:sb/3477393/
MCVGGLEERAAKSRERCSPLTASGWKYGRYLTHTHLSSEVENKRVDSTVQTVKARGGVDRFLTPILDHFRGYHHVIALGIPDQMDMTESILRERSGRKMGLTFGLISM